MNQSVIETTVKSYLNPLFWVHGEGEDAIRNEIRQMHQNGINSFTVEPRPHIEYLKEGWWQDLAIIMDEAGKRTMEVWIFDDGDYPSGSAGGEVVKKYPKYRKKFLKKAYIDAKGPMTGSSFLINQWLEGEDRLAAVVAAKRVLATDTIESDTLIELTQYMVNGVLYWDLPDGDWRIFILIRSLECAEDHTKNHINPLEKEAVKAFIDYTYEATYHHLKEEFGKTIKGFFTDEPRFGNFPSYSARIGTMDMPIPYSDQLLDILSEEAGFRYVKYLPLLWQEGGAITAEIRYIYMNVVSRLFGENFTGQIGQWCSERGVQIIGHVVEENGAHARLGFGAGHFFRSTSGLHQSGLDIVYNIMPGYTSGTYNTAIFNVNVDFNHWGLAKMASSASHIDPKKDGITMCEAFGAYGWQEGLKLMKWITDHICVRGVNIIVPHAFTLKEFPDTDCPPHFYAGGHNPQWKDFHIWSAYANRVCSFITGGVHIASAAVVYPAEAEWGGNYEPFERTVKALAMSQIDCDIVPIDCLTEERICGVKENKLQIHKESYSALVVPYSQFLPLHFTKKLQQFINNGLPVVFLKEFPERSYFETTFELHGAALCDYETIGNWFMKQDLQDISVKGNSESLRFYHYNKEGKGIYFFVNESKFETIDVTIQFKETESPILYHPMNQKNYRPTVEPEGMRLSLEPFESIFALFGETVEQPLHEKGVKSDYCNEVTIQGPWKIGISSAESYPSFDTISETTLCNITKQDLLPEFSGVIRYETGFDVQGLSNQSILLDLGSAYETVNVWLNNQKIADLICPPYTVELNKGILKEQDNILVVEVTNTLAKSIHTIFDRYMPQEPSGLLGPVRVLWK